MLTDSTGYYSKSVSYGWSGTATAQKAGYTFSPPNFAYTSVTANQASKNYTANPTSVPNISLSPKSLTFIKPATDRSAEKSETPETETVEDEADAPADGKYATGLIIPDEVKAYWATHRPSRKYRSMRDLPASKDWSIYDSPVRSQGQCGSCWAFTTVALVENMANRANLAIDKDFAEQTLVSCTHDGEGCYGGWYGTALNYIRQNGIPPESCHPYSASNGSCGSQCAKPDFKVKVSSYPNDALWGESDFSAEDLKGALQDGPLAVCMYVSDSFHAYRGGIYRYSPDEPYSFGHAVLLVGYNDSEQCFKVKNSWGTWWGEGGYLRIAYDEVTGVLKFGSYAVKASGIFIEEQGGEVQEITLSNTGTANLNVSSISSDKTWLKVSPASFDSILPGEQKKISVSVTSWTAVTSPQESANITVTSDDPDESAVKIQLTAVISATSAEKAVLKLSSPFYAVSSEEEGILTVSVGNSAGETYLDVANEGEGDMVWTASTFDSWLTITQGSSGTNSGRVTISFLSNTSGPRTGSVTVTSDDAANSPQTFNIYQSDIEDDYDDDGMADWFELVYGFDSSNPDDAFGDADEDGLNNLREYQIGTNPRNADTDGDGMSDGYEVANGLNPLASNLFGDVITALKILSGMNASLALSNADADKNGKVEIKDAVFILQKIAGLR